MRYNVEKFDIVGLGSDLYTVYYEDVYGCDGSDIYNFSVTVFDGMSDEYRFLLQDRVVLIALDKKAIRFSTEDLYVQVPYEGSVSDIIKFGNDEYDSIEYSEIVVGYGKGVSNELLKFLDEDIWEDVEVSFLGDTKGCTVMVGEITYWTSVAFNMLLSRLIYETHIKDVSYIEVNVDEHVFHYTMKSRIYDSFGNSIDLKLGSYEDYSGGGIFLSSAWYDQHLV